MKRFTGKCGFVWYVVAVLILASCAPTLLGRAKQSAAVSNSIYESLNPQVVNGITEIVQKDRAGTITTSSTWTTRMTVETTTPL